MKIPFNDQTLRLLVEKAGFSSSGAPHLAARFLSEILNLAPFYENSNWRKVEARIGNSGCYYFVLHLMSEYDLLEHGSGVGGSWLTDDGELVQKALLDIDWEAPVHLSGEELFATPIKIFEYDEEATPEEEIRAECCACCGDPEAVYAFLQDLLANGTPLETFDGAAELLPDPGLRQFVSYMLFDLGLTGKDGRMTSHGCNFLAKLANHLGWEK